VSGEIAAALERLRRLTVTDRHEPASVPAIASGMLGNARGPEISGEPASVPAIASGSPPAPPPPGSASSSLAAPIAARRGACARLRRVLADGAWHSALELLEVGGLRYGGRLHEIRRGDDGGQPLAVEGEPRSGERGRLWFYRVAPPRGQAALPLGESDRGR
jgi:hypothetical protein